MTAIDELVLPSGGTVRFADTDSLTGKQYLTIQALIMEDAAQTILRGATALAGLLIESWSIPYDPAMPIPKGRGGQNSLANLNGRDTKAIIHHLVSHARAVMFEDDLAETDEGKSGPGSNAPNA